MTDQRTETAPAGGGTPELASETPAGLTRAVPLSLREWNFCPNCASVLVAAQGEPYAQPHLHCPACGRAWYANPRPTASVLAERADNGRLLLVRRGIEPFKGLWDTPGGFLEENEGSAEAALRELREETGLHGRITGIVGAWPDVYGDDKTTLNVFYRVVLDEIADAAPASDVAEIGWFAADELPGADELAFDCVPVAVQEWKHQARTA